MRPQTPCTEEAPTGSSIFRTLSMNSTEYIISMPQIAPMTTAPQGDTVSQPAVIPTKPARMPFRVNDRDGLPYFSQLMLRAKKPPAQAARLVLRNTSEIATWSAVVAAASCDPGLKPNHPNQRMNTPSAAIVRLCPGIAFDWPSLPYLPMRGPRMAAPTSAIQPPTECTMVEPAKSWKVVPKVFIMNEPASLFISQPPPQVQCPETG